MELGFIGPLFIVVLTSLLTVEANIQDLPTNAAPMVLVMQPSFEQNEPILLPVIHPVIEIESNRSVDHVYVNTVFIMGQTLPLVLQRVLGRPVTLAWARLNG